MDKQIVPYEPKIPVAPTTLDVPIVYGTGLSLQEEHEARKIYHSEKTSLNKKQKKAKEKEAPGEPLFTFYENNKIVLQCLLQEPKLKDGHSMIEYKKSKEKAEEKRALEKEKRAMERKAAFHKAMTEHDMKWGRGRFNRKEQVVEKEKEQVVEKEKEQAVEKKAGEANQKQMEKKNSQKQNPIEKKVVAAEEKKAPQKNNPIEKKKAGKKPIKTAEIILEQVRKRKVEDFIEDEQASDDENPPKKKKVTKKATPEKAAKKAMAVADKNEKAVADKKVIEKKKAGEKQIKTAEVEDVIEDDQASDDENPPNKKKATKKATPEKAAKKSMAVAQKNEKAVADKKVIKKKKAEVEDVNEDEQASDDDNPPKKKKYWRNPIFITIRTSPAPLYKVIQKMNEEQRKTVKEIGFGGLLKLRLEANSPELMTYLVQRFDSCRCAVKLEKDEMVIDEEDVVSVFDLPKGGKQISEFSEKDDKEILIKWRKRWNVQDSPITSRMTKDLCKRQDCGDDFKREFVVFVVTTMFKSHHNRTVNPKILKSVQDIAEIKNLDWCSYMIDRLVESTEEFRKSDTKRRVYTGPASFLVLCYLDRMIFKLRKPNSRYFPICSNWIAADVNKRVREERDLNGLGQGKVVERLKKTGMEQV